MKREGMRIKIEIHHHLHTFKVIGSRKRRSIPIRFINKIFYLIVAAIFIRKSSSRILSRWYIRGSRDAYLTLVLINEKVVLIENKTFRSLFVTLLIDRFLKNSFENSSVMNRVFQKLQLHLDIYI